MELSSSHARTDEQPAIRRPVRGPHGGWQQREIDALKARIGEAERSGDSLRSVFDQLALELGRKPNSIRNFYYAQLRTQDESAAGRALPFETFSTDEVESHPLAATCPFLASMPTAMRSPYCSTAFFTKAGSSSAAEPKMTRETPPCR